MQWKPIDYPNHPEMDHAAISYTLCLGPKLKTRVNSTDEKENQREFHVLFIELCWDSHFIAEVTIILFNNVHCFSLSGYILINFLENVVLENLHN